MSLARLVITAVTVEGRSKASVARAYGITRFWVQTLVKRFEVEGEAAFQPYSRSAHQPARGQPGGGGPDRQAPQDPHQARPGRRRRNHRCPPGH